LWAGETQEKNSADCMKSTGSGERENFMRIGSNPVKVKKPSLNPPQPVTVVIITYIPYLSGYFQSSLEVLIPLLLKVFGRILKKLLTCWYLIMEAVMKFANT